MSKRIIRVGSRDSKLAVAQTEIILEQIKKANPDIEIELVTLKTTGDLILNKTLDKIGGKGLFVKELDAALLDNKIDISVSSLKDLPMEENPHLPIIAYSKREDPRDALVLPASPSAYENFTDKIGTSSARRMLQLKQIYKSCTVQSVRGNIVTRLKKLDDGEFSSLILASAGLKRIGLQNRIGRYFSVDEIIPAAGQGILAVQARAGFDVSFLNSVTCKESEFCATAERSFVRELDGGCSSPVAAYAYISDSQINLTGLYYSEDRQKHIVEKACGNASDAEKIGIELARLCKTKAETL